MDEVIKKYFNQFTNNEETYEGYISGESSFKAFIDELKGLGLCYTIRDSKNYQNLLKGASPAIHFDQTSGLPYITDQWLDMHCVHGKKYYGSKKADNKQDHPSGKKSRFLIQNTKKIGCPAKISVLKRNMFTEEKYQGCENISKYRKEKISVELRERMKSENKPVVEVHFYIKIMHSHSHPTTINKKYNDEIPPFLHDHPPKYIKHVMTRLSSASIEFSPSDLTIISESVVSVNSSVSSHADLVDFDTVNCSCEDFKKQKQICKHFCACFLFLPNFTYDRLPKEYRENPLHYIFTDLQPTYEVIENTITTNNDSNLQPTYEVVENTITTSNGNNIWQIDLLEQNEQLRELFKNALDLTYNLPPGDYSHIINKAVEVNKLMEECLQKSIDDIVNVQTNSKKRQLHLKDSSEKLHLPTKKKFKYIGRVVKLLRVGDLPLL